MIDYTAPVRTAYFQALDGNVVIGTKDVAIYDKQAPNDALYPYIVLSTQTGVGQYTKNNHGQEVTMLIDIVNGKIGAVDTLDVNDIANQIYTIIHDNNNTMFVLPDGLTVLSTRLLLDTTDTNQNGAYKISRRLIRFGHTIHEQINT